jgi:hypothetical protein
LLLPPHDPSCLHFVAGPGGVGCGPGGGGARVVEWAPQGTFGACAQSSQGGLPTRDKAPATCLANIASLRWIALVRHHRTTSVSRNRRRTSHRGWSFDSMFRKHFTFLRGCTRWRHRRNAQGGATTQLQTRRAPISRYVAHGVARPHSLVPPGASLTKKAGLRRRPSGINTGTGTVFHSKTICIGLLCEKKGRHIDR